MKKIFFALSGLAFSSAALGAGIETTAGSEDSFLSFDQIGWKGSVGGGAALVPRYEGSSRSRVRFLPLVDLEAGKFFVSSMRGAGMNLSDNPDFSYGPRITYSRGRRQTDDVRLSGMGDISASGQVGLFFNLRQRPWYGTGDIRSDRHGTRLDLEGGYEISPLPSDRIRIGAKVSWADPRYMQSFFGVSAIQSAASGLPAYAATSGVKDYGLNLNWRHFYDRHWFSNAGIQARQLSGSAKSSPLTLSRSETSASFLIGYRF